MRKIRDVLRMKFELCLKDRQIARSCSIPRSSVANYLERAKEAGLSWPLPAELDDEALERRLFGVISRHPAVVMPLPDFSAIRAELRADRHVTLQLLWQEYKQNHPEGYQYSRFCELYGRWERKLDPVLRQDYRAGERLFVDHAGRTLTITDRETGRTGEAYLFVAVLGASNYTYAEATERRDLAAWIGSHTRALEFFGGAPTVVTFDYVPGNIIIPEHLEDTSEVAERRFVRPQKRLLGRPGIGPVESAPAGHAAQAKDLQHPPFAVNLRFRLVPVDLAFHAPLVGLRNAGLPAPQSQLLSSFPYIAADCAFPDRGVRPLPGDSHIDAMRRVPLLARRLQVRLQNRVDELPDRLQLRTLPLRRLALCRKGIGQRLPHHPSVYSKLAGQTSNRLPAELVLPSQLLKQFHFGSPVQPSSVPV